MFIRNITSHRHYQYQPKFDIQSTFMIRNSPVTLTLGIIRDFECNNRQNISVWDTSIESNTMI